MFKIEFNEVNDREASSRYTLYTGNPYILIAINMLELIAQLSIFKNLI